jgi:predicted nucleic acid-binding protein
VSVVFLDTVALIALWNASDQWHATADRVYSDLRTKRAEVVTTRYVLLECGNTAARTPFRNDVTVLRTSLTRTNRLISPTEGDWNDAWEAYERNDAGGAGIVDQISIVVMRRLGISEVFTNDWHFTAAGFKTLF